MSREKIHDTDDILAKRNENTNDIRMSKSQY